MKLTKIAVITLAVITLGVALSNNGYTREPVELARVNNSVITDQDLYDELGSLTQGQKESFLKDPYNRREILKRVIEMHALANKAKEKKLDQNPMFQAKLKALQLRALASEDLEKEVTPQVTANEVRRYYEAHKERYTTDRVEVQHILLNTDKEARKVLDLARKPNANFEKLAREFSQDPNVKDNGGNLGLIDRDTLVPAFTEVAFSTPVGKVAGPVRTSFGYHVIKVERRVPGTPLDFKDIELRVQADLIQTLGRNHTDQVEKGQKISINRQALDNWR